MKSCAKQREREIAMRNIAKHPRNNSATIERLTICPHGRTNPGTTGDVRPSLWREYLRRAAFELVEAGRHRGIIAANAFEKNFSFASTAGICHGDNLLAWRSHWLASLMSRKISTSSPIFSACTCNKRIMPYDAGEDTTMAHRDRS